MVLWAIKVLFMFMKRMCCIHEGRKREIFKAGLITAAKSTNALILTGGSNAGTMKLVGEAVKDGQFMVQVKIEDF